MNDITPQQAREQLAEAEAATRRRTGDRRIHALATAAFGLLVGGYLVLSRVSDDTRWETVVLVAYVLLLIWLARWQTAGARTWPRRARRASRIGLGVTLALFLAAIIGFNVLAAQEQPGSAAPTENLALLLVAGLLVAAPMLVAAVVIERGERP